MSTILNFGTVHNRIVVVAFIYICFSIHFVVFLLCFCLVNDNFICLCIFLDDFSVCEWLVFLLEPVIFLLFSFVFYLSVVDLVNFVFPIL